MNININHITDNPGKLFKLKNFISLRTWHVNNNNYIVPRTQYNPQHIPIIYKISRNQSFMFLNVQEAKSVFRMSLFNFLTLDFYGHQIICKTCELSFLNDLEEIKCT